MMKQDRPVENTIDYAGPNTSIGRDRPDAWQVVCIVSLLASVFASFVSHTLVFQFRGGYWCLAAIACGILGLVASVILVRRHHHDYPMVLLVISVAMVLAWIVDFLLRL